MFRHSPPNNKNKCEEKYTNRILNRSGKYKRQHKGSFFFFLFIFHAALFRRLKLAYEGNKYMYCRETYQRLLFWGFRLNSNCDINRGNLFAENLFWAIIQLPTSRFLFLLIFKDIC